MFEQDNNRKYINVKKEQIITLLNSTIRPHVAMAGKASEPTDAFACTIKAKDSYETLIFFHLTKSHTGVVYKWDEGPQPREKAKAVEREALKFLEAMGFQMDSFHFRKKSLDEQQRIMQTLPCFQPDLSYLKEAPAGEEEIDEVMAVEAEEGAGAEMDDVMVESVDVSGDIPSGTEAVPAEAAEPVREAAQDELVMEVEPQGVETKAEQTGQAVEITPEPGIAEAPAAEVTSQAEDFFDETPAVAQGIPEGATTNDEVTAPEPEPAAEFDEAISVEVTPDEPEEEVGEGLFEAESSLQSKPPEGIPEVPFEAAEPKPAPTEVVPARPQEPAAQREEILEGLEGLEGLEPLARFLASM
jgi:hypothetical protein